MRKAWPFLRGACLGLSHAEHGDTWIGSRYFDVLDGEYRLEEARPGVTRVQLSSHHRLTTTLAPYAHLWSDAILPSVQERILRVIQSRCESAPATPG